MPIPLHISPRLIPSISSLYQDPSRIFLEFVDNSLDSAEQLYSPASNSYLRPVNIKLHILDQSFQRIVSISDNCAGIDRLKKVIESVGNSEKKADFTTNGQFGYGIYSFMALFESMDIISKTHDLPAKQITIHRKQFDANRQEEVLFHDPVNVDGFPHATGTIIKLYRCDKDKLRSFSAEKIHQEIERHFELILQRNNLSIHVCYEHVRHSGLNWEKNCKAFDYEALNGIKFEIKPNQWKNPRYPIHCYFIVTPRLNIDKPPIFVVKGRRIATLSETRSFDSKRKRDLWSHPNLTGYVDLKDMAQATFSRNDVKQNPKMKMISRSLQSIESDLEEMLENITEEKKQSQFKVLEKELIAALSQLAVKEQVRLLSATMSGRKPQSNDEEESVKSDKLDPSSVLPPKTNPPSASTASHRSRRAGFDIQIVNHKPPLNEKQELIRSQRLGDQIVIYHQHPEFRKRMKLNLKKEWILTPTLISYLACEIAIHFRDEIIVSKGIHQYSKDQMIDYAEFVYRFEDHLAGLTGKILKLDNVL